MVSRGTPAELDKFVSSPETWAEGRKETRVVVVDATALWLKLRGEDKVLVSEDERRGHEARKRLSKAFKKLERNDPEQLKQFEEEKAKFFEDLSNQVGQIEASYSSAGDTYRVTLINFSAVENWFDPSRDPKSVKGKSILLVPSKWHCRVSDMDIENGVWLRDVEYPTSEGEIRQFEKGTSTRGLLGGWVQALKQLNEDDQRGTLENLEIWGQPRAWTDELIAVWTVEFIRREHGRALVFADCLGSQ